MAGVALDLLRAVSPAFLSRQGRIVKKAPARILAIDELSAYLKIAKSTLYKLAQEGKIPAQKVERHWRFHLAVIDRSLGDKRAK